MHRTVKQKAESKEHKVTGILSVILIPTWIFRLLSFVCALGAWVRWRAAGPIAWAAPNPLHHWHQAATQSDSGVEGKCLTQDLGQSINPLIWKTSLM